MEFSLPLPDEMEEHCPLAATNWKNFRHRFKFFTKVQTNDSELQASKSESILLFLGGQLVIDVVKNLPIYADERDIAANIVLDRVSEICLPRFILLYERFKFFSCKQKLEECICQFLFRLLHLSELCEFEDSTDTYVANRIIHGATDQTLRESLLGINMNNLTDIIEVCRTVTKCQDGQCCVDFESYSDAFLKGPNMSVPEASGRSPLIYKDTGSGQSDCLEVETSALVGSEDTVTKPLERNFWQFEELVHKSAASSTASFVPKSVLKTNVSQFKCYRGRWGKNVNFSGSTVNTLSEADIKKDDPSPCTENQSKAQNCSLFWDEVTFDESDGDIEDGKNGRGGSTDGDSIDDVPVTVCVPLPETRTSDLEDEDEERNNKEPQALKSSGISRLTFTSQSPSLLGGLVEAEVSTSLQVNKLKNPSSLVSMTEHESTASIQVQSSSTLHFADAEVRSVDPMLVEFSDSDLPDSLLRLEVKKPNQLAGSFFDLYSHWMETKSSTSSAGVSDNIMSTHLHAQTAHRGKKASRTGSRRSAPKAKQKQNCVPRCSKDDSDSESELEGNKTPENSILGKVDGASHISLLNRCTSNIDCQQKPLQGSVDVSRAVPWGSVDVGKAVPRGSVDAGRAAPQGSVDVVKAVPQGSVDAGRAVPRGSGKSGQVKKRMPARTKRAQFVQSLLHVEKLKGQGCQSNEVCSKSDIKIDRTLVDKNQFEADSRKSRSHSKSAVAVQSLLSQYGDYNSLLRDTTLDSHESLEDYDFSEIVKKSVEEVVQGRFLQTLKEPPEDTQSFFAQYDLQKSKSGLAGKSQRRGDSVEEVSEGGEGSQVPVENDGTAAKLMKMAEKREIRTSEGAKRVTCLSLKL